MAARLVKYNLEYFGYIAGFDDGRIALYNHSAAQLMETPGITETELDAHMLEELTIRPDFHLDTPLLVWFELTRRCNLTCPHCYIEAGVARADELETTEIRRLLAEMSAMGVWAVTFTGGEPTMHPDFPELVSFAREHQLLVGIATNGTYLSDELLKRLPRDGVIISISYDNLHIRNPKHPISDFRVASRAVLRSRQMGFETNIMTNTHKRNMDQLDEVLDWAKDLGVSIRSIPFAPLGRGRNYPELENTPEDVPRLASFWLKEKEWEDTFHRRVGLCVGNIFDYGETLGYMTRRCPSGRYLCYIAADGTVYPCTSCAGEEILSPGNIKGKSFAEFWRSDWEIRHYNWDNFADTCRGCPINNEDYYCSSRCPAFSYARHRTLFDCGASPFQVQSTIVRTAMLHHHDLGKAERTETSAPTEVADNDRRSL